MGATSDLNCQTWAASASTTHSHGQALIMALPIGVAAGNAQVAL